MQVAVDIQAEPLELSGMHRHMGQQDVVLERRRTVDLVEMLQILCGRIVIVVPEHEPLLALQFPGDSDSLRAEREVSKVPDDVALRDDRVPPPHELGVVLLDAGEGPVRLDGIEPQDVPVPEVRVGDEKRLGHRGAARISRILFCNAG